MSPTAALPIPGNHPRSVITIVMVLFLSSSIAQDQGQWDYQISILDQHYEEMEYSLMTSMADSMYTVADSLNYREVLPEIGMYRGIGNYLLSVDYELAVSSLNLALENLSLIPQEYHPHIYMYLGSAYLRAGSYKEEMVGDEYRLPDSLTRLALATFRGRDNRDGEIRALKEVATVEIYKGNFEEALQLLTPCYEMALETRHPILRSLVNTIGIVYSIGQRHEEAIEFIEKYYTFIEDKDLMWRDAYCFQLLGNAYKDLEEWSSATRNYQKAISLIDGENGREVRVWSYWPLAQSYIYLEQYDSAEFCVNEAESYYEYVGDDQMNSFMSIIRAHIDTNRGEFSEAEKYIEEYADIALRMSMRDREYNVTHARYKLYKAWGKPLLALASLERFREISDSVRRARFSSRFEDYKVRLETAKQKVDILELETELQARNNRIILISSTFIILLMIALYIIKRYQNQRIRAQKELAVKEKELADFTLSMVRKNQVMSELNALVDESFRKSNGDLITSVHKMKRLLTVNKSQEDNWNQFLEHFGAVHHDFFDKLKRKYDNLSSKDLRHCALLRMNLSLKESADILGVESNSVKMARYRLKKKMNLPEETDLGSVFLNLN